MATYSPLKMPPTLAACISPTADHTIPLGLSLSPDGKFLIIALRNKIVEVCCCYYHHLQYLNFLTCDLCVQVFRLVDGTWRPFAIYAERLLFRQNIEYDSISAVAWHPTNPFHFIVVYSKGRIFSAHFSEDRVRVRPLVPQHFILTGFYLKSMWTDSTIDLARSLNESTTLFLRQICFNDEMTEMSGVSGNKILTFSSPWSRCQIYFNIFLLTNSGTGNGIERISLYGQDVLNTSIPDGYPEVIFSSYIEKHELLLVYPLGLL